MKVYTRADVVVHLELTTKEAMWLKEVTQNPIGPDEDHFSAEMRKKFWEALQQVPFDR